MDLGALDGALEPWFREREARAWLRVQQLDAEEQETRLRAHHTRMRAASALGELGAHASEARALDARAAKLRKRREWYALCRLKVRTYTERRRGCGEFTYTGVGISPTTGEVTDAEWPRRCGAHVACADCARARAKKHFRKLVAAIEATHEREMRAWRRRGCPSGEMPIVTMLTITMRSSTLDDLHTRRKLFSDAWNRFRSWYQYDQGRRLPYAWTVECTEGQRDQGHVHGHAVVVMPFVQFKYLSAAWDRATKGVGGHIQGPGPAQRARGTPKQAAWYLAKYVSKGVKFKSVQVAAAWVRAQHGKRGVSCSRDWWEQKPSERLTWQLTLKRTSATVTLETVGAPTVGAPSKELGRVEATTSRAGPGS